MHTYLVGKKLSLTIQIVVFVSGMKTANEKQANEIVIRGVVGGGGGPNAVEQHRCCLLIILSD